MHWSWPTFSIMSRFRPEGIIGKLLKKEENVEERFDQDLTVRVSKKLKEKVSAEAKKKNIPVSQMLREIISEKFPLKKQKSAAV